MADTTTPAGVPEIPAGQQLGGRGAQAPENPVKEQLTTEAHAQVQKEPPTEPPAAPEVPANPLTPETPPESKQESKQEPAKAVEPQDSYVHTSIVYLAEELGVTEDDFDAVYANAVKHDDMSLINPDALGKDLTDAQKVRVKQLAELSVQEFKQGVERAKQDAYSVAGGEVQWTTAVQAFNANAEQDQKGYAGYLADNGRLKECAEYVMKVTRAGGHISENKQAPVQGGTGSTASGLSKEAYQVEVGKIERELGNRSMNSPEIKIKLDDLNARRALGRQQGL